jgi:hypothetical protein
LDEFRIAGLLGLSVDGPAAYLLSVIRREHFTEAEQIEISDGNSHR